MNTSIAVAALARSFGFPDGETEGRSGQPANRSGLRDQSRHVQGGDPWLSYQSFDCGDFDESEIGLLGLVKSMAVRWLLSFGADSIGLRAALRRAFAAPLSAR